MLRRHRFTSTFLIVGISVLFSIASVHSHYNRLLEADFLILGLKFEAGDIDDLLADKQITLEFIPSRFLPVHLPGVDQHGINMASSEALTSAELPFSPLRC